MATVTSATAKGEDTVEEVTPSESTSAAPAALERVEVRPGVLIKMNAQDKKAWEQQQADEVKNREAWQKTQRPETAAAETPETTAAPRAQKRK